MLELPAALGFLRSDVSGTHQQWDEIQIRSLAKRLGYDLRKTVVFNATTDRPVQRLCTLLVALGVDALIVPSAAHFEGEEVPADLVTVANICTVKPESTFPRRGDPPDPPRSDAQQRL
ncbi:hypothetical protein [Nocardia jejuensis]|uniref:hypothetical protein n=1 Tax=Nocardia jejuensis TaxID=328049 RepID=UPI000831D75E|nr:hypothetical protein [Nocardia jejuensis]